MSAALSFGHGANDAQKSMGVIAALLVASWSLDTLAVPFWAKSRAGRLTVGTALGGWRIVRTIGRGYSGCDQATGSPARAHRVP